MTTYDDGTDWTGEVYTDNIDLGHGTPEVNFAFVSITDNDGFFSDNSYQGIIGLGPSQNADDGTSAYVSYAASAGEEPILSFELCAATGTMWLGTGYDTTKGSGSAFYTPLLPIDPMDNPDYAVDIDDLAFGSASLGFGPDVFAGPIIDTGTSLEYLPTPVFQALLTAINADPGLKTVFGNSAVLTALSDTGSGRRLLDGRWRDVGQRRRAHAAADVLVSEPRWLARRHRDGRRRRVVLLRRGVGPVLPRHRRCRHRHRRHSRRWLHDGRHHVDRSPAQPGRPRARHRLRDGGGGDRQAGLARQEAAHPAAAPGSRAPLARACRSLERDARARLHAVVDRR